MKRPDNQPSGPYDNFDGWMSRGDWKARKRQQCRGVSEAALDAVFDTLAKGQSVSIEPIFQTAVEGWRDENGGVDMPAFERSLLVTRVGQVFSYLGIAVLDFFVFTLLVGPLIQPGKLGFGPLFEGL